jgi:ATP-dependent HslUV protease ATP-binding subunit HslU
VDPAQERHKRTRDKLKQLLIDGKLEEREVEVESHAERADDRHAGVAGRARRHREISATMLQEMMPKRKKKRTVKVSEARRILFEQELEKLIDLEDVTADALERVEKLGIIFLDEIDKIAGERSQMGGPDVSREGVQRDLLPDRRGLERADEVRHGEDRPRALHRRRRVSRIEAERPHSRAAGPVPDSRRAEAAHRAGLRPHHDGAENALTKQYAALVEPTAPSWISRPTASARSRASRRCSMSGWRTSARADSTPS